MKLLKKISQRKKKSFFLGYALLIALFITAYGVSWTTAKNATTLDTPASDTGRVAKWYVTEDWEDYELFGEENHYDFGLTGDKFVYGSVDTGLLLSGYGGGAYGKVNTVKSFQAKENVLAPGTAEKAEIKVKYPKIEPEVAYKFALKIDTSAGAEIDSYKYNTNNLFYSDHATTGSGWNIAIGGSNTLFWTPLKFRLYDRDNKLIFNGVSLANRNEYEVVSLKLQPTTAVAGAVTNASANTDDKAFVDAVDGQYASSYPNWRTEWSRDDLIPNECQSFVLATYINTHPDVICSETIYPGSGKVDPDAITVGHFEWVWPYNNMDKDADGSFLFNREDYYDTFVLKNTRKARENNSSVDIPKVAVKIAGIQQQVD